MAGIEFVVIFTVTALDLSVMPRSVRTYQLMSDSEIGKFKLKARL